MGQGEVFEMLSMRLLSGDDDYFTIRKIAVLLNSTSRVVYPQVRKLSDFGFLEVLPSLNCMKYRAKLEKIPSIWKEIQKTEKKPSA